MFNHRLAARRCVPAPEGYTMMRRHLGRMALAVAAIAVVLSAAPARLHGQAVDDEATAHSLAAMLRAGRTVVSNHQNRINDPLVGDKGLSSMAFLQQTVAIYRESTGVDPGGINPSSRLGRLLRAQMDAIAEVIDAHQATLNQQGVGFKAFIPAYFARMVNESFEKRARGEALIKVTAPEQLIRNRKARPDSWEREIITGKLLTPEWKRDQPWSAVTSVGGRQAFRMMMPEYYSSSCLSCHGSPKGETDITGYPKEGGREGDLGGVISIVLFR